MPTHNPALIENLYRKKELLENNDPRHKEIRPMLVILGGGMAGAGGGGACIALHELGLQNVFDTVVGVSAGACDGAYFLAGYEQVRLGASIYYEELPGRFVNWWRRPVADIDYLMDVFRSGKKALDTEAAKKHRSNFYVVATDYRRKEAALINAKEAKPNLIEALRASTALPGVYGKKVILNGRKYVDGSAIDPFPIIKITTQFQPTDVLVIPNRTVRMGFSSKATTFEKIFLHLFVRDLLPYAGNRYSRYRDSFNKLISSEDITSGIIWAPYNMDPVEMDAKKVKQLADDMHKTTLDYFETS